jgi:two-component system, OmpR family, KDP operon response regulator KdpE
MNEKKNTILVIDDEPQIQKMLGVLLDLDNYKIVESLTGKQGVRMAASLKPDLILLDLGLPDMNGKEVIAAIREWSQVPIIVLSACSLDEEITASLNIGANDYVIKPFNFNVLMARINSSLRTSIVREVGDSQLYNGQIRMDLVRHEVFINDLLTSFTPKEYDLLRYFMVNRGKMLTHKEILKALWGAAHADDTTYLRVYIGQIREKIEEDTSNPKFITTEPGIGYRMESIPFGIVEAA